MKFNIIASLALSMVSADVPAHCTRDEVYGEWHFHVSSETQQVNLYESKEVCTHTFPNHVQIIKESQPFKFEKSDVWKIKMLDDYKASATFCKGGDACESSISGKWTPIYAQHLVIELDNGQRLVSNFRYNFKESIPNNAKSIAQLNTNSKNFKSDCSKTMVGFVQKVGGGQEASMKKYPIQCMYGERVSHTDIEQEEKVNVKDDNEVLEEYKIVNHARKGKKASLASKQKKSYKKNNLHLEHKPSDEMDVLISSINANDLGWKADTCKLQKHHPDYSCDGPVNLAQVETKGFAEEGDMAFQQAISKAQEWQNNYKTAAEIPDDKIPVNYDFRDIDGYNFLTDVRDQSHCGSCFTFGFVQAMEARIRLQTGKQVPNLSVQQVLNCNFMNEGCSGGWPHLNGFFGENGYMVSQECTPYVGRTGNQQKCSNSAQCKPIAKVAQTRKVGGFGLGQSNEKDIMKELLRNGPLSVEFEASSSITPWALYKEGILSHKGTQSFMKMKIESALSEEDKESLTQENLDEMVSDALDNQMVQTDGETEGAPQYNDKTMEQSGIAWMEQSHTVLLAGWGYEPTTQTKYWILRNSYGPSWGMKGDFMVEKGRNHLAVEADIVAFDPVLCSEASTESCFVG